MTRVTPKLKELAGPHLKKEWTLSERSHQKASCDQ